MADNIHDWFAELLDAKLKEFNTDQERYSFLIRQGNIWQQRYGRFVATDGASECPHPQFGQPVATDFLIIVTDIEKRKGQLEAKRP